MATLTSIHTGSQAATHSAFAAIRQAAHAVLAGVSSFFAFLARDAEEHERARTEAYLAEAVDRYDLEFRMRELDRGLSNSHPQWFIGSRY